MSKTVTIALTAFLAASIGLTLGLLLNRTPSPQEPPAADLTASLQEFQNQTTAAAHDHDQKLQAALDQLNQANQSLQNLTQQVTALSQQNQNLIHQLLQFPSELTDPNIPPPALFDTRIPITFNTKPVIPPPSTDTFKANVAEKNKNIEDFIVFVTKTGTKYHRPDCPSLTQSKIPLTLTEAIAKGYTPCTRCKPPGF